MPCSPGFPSRPSIPGSPGSPLTPRKVGNVISTGACICILLQIYIICNQTKSFSLTSYLGDITVFGMSLPLSPGGPA